MDTIDLNSILERNNIITEISNFLENFKKNKNNLTIKRGIYIYGPTGSGKTYFVNSLLKKLNYPLAAPSANISTRINTINSILDLNTFQVVSNNNTNQLN